MNSHFGRWQEWRKSSLERVKKAQNKKLKLCFGMRY